jgi:predicted DNA binding CopG/RHH family protein
MGKKIRLDNFEQDVEDNFESLQPILNMYAEMHQIKQAALSHIKRKKSITLRVREVDLEMMRIKDSKLGVPYQTYINMLIHKDAMTGA